MFFNLNQPKVFENEEKNSNLKVSEIHNLTRIFDKNSIIKLLFIQTEIRGKYQFCCALMMTFESSCLKSPLFKVQQETCPSLENLMLHKANV